MTSLNSSEAAIGPRRQVTLEIAGKKRCPEAECENSRSHQGVVRSGSNAGYENRVHSGDLEVQIARG